MLYSLSANKVKGALEPFSKVMLRILHDSKNDRINCYSQFGEAYKKRNKFVHEGKFDVIAIHHFLIISSHAII